MEFDNKEKVILNKGLSKLLKEEKETLSAYENVYGYDSELTTEQKELVSQIKNLEYKIND